MAKPPNSASKICNRSLNYVCKTGPYCCYNIEKKVLFGHSRTYNLGCMYILKYAVKLYYLISINNSIFKYSDLCRRKQNILCMNLGYKIGICQTVL